jgi:hypothetical protein
MIHTQNQLPTLPGSGLLVCVGVAAAISRVAAPLGSELQRL